MNRIRKALVALVAAVAVLVVDTETAKEIAAFVGTVFVYLVPND